MKKRVFSLFVLIFVLLIVPSSALAQTYYFRMDEEIVNAFWNDDGTLALDYNFTFTNSGAASPIDYIDVGLPNANYDINSINADVGGAAITDIQTSSYVTYGVALGLGSNAIQPGATGKVHAYVGKVEKVLYEDSQDSSYASAVFSPTWFGSQYIYGNTHLQMIFHLPPGVKPEEPKWHAAPAGWQSEPVAGIDDQGRITYTWDNPQASGSTQYMFGASFPKQYVPAAAITTPSFLDRLGINSGNLMGGMCCLGFAVFFFGSVALSVYSTRRRQMQYLPPKISIEGHGIKRGLTAVEAAILMEESMDKIMTMILFSTIKKGVAEVTSRDPLEIKVTEPLPTDLYVYETEFLQAFKLPAAGRRKALQEMMINLVKSVSQKIKGFSRKETVDYYKDIMTKAWAQVEAADTPEVKSQKYDENMEWTMLDKHYDDRTREVFRTQPVFLPMWWGRYDPTYRPSAPSGGHMAAPAMPGPVGSGGKGISMPTLPGADFAAGMVGGVQSFSSKVVGSLSDFTSGITTKTTPVPKSSSSGRSGGGGGGGGGCACACACAGCACACAGGGR
jgi:hypothetical protein